MFLLGWQIIIPAQAQTNGDLALNKPIISVSSTAAGSSPALAVDGNPATYWASGGGGAQWLAIDLGANINIGTVVTKWGTDLANNYDIELSDDGMVFSVVWSGINGDFNSAINRSGRYLQLRIKSGINPANYQLVALEVYAAAVPAPTPTTTMAPLPTSTPIPTVASTLTQIPNTPTSAPLPTATPTPSNITIFENGFEGGIVNNNFVGWDGTTLEGTGSITAEPIIKTDGQYSALFNAPNGSTLSPVDRTFSYKQFTFPAGDVLWAKTKFRFEGAGTSIQFGGGFLIQIAENSGYYSQRWNVEFYSPSQVFDRPNNTAYPFNINGSSHTGWMQRIHSNKHTFVEPDTWYEVKMKMDYTGTYPIASYWLNGVYQDSLEDTTTLSTVATRPTYVHVGAPWWDQATREKLYIDQVGLYSADPDAGQPVPTATPIPPVPTLTPSPTPIPCTLTSASWNVSGSTSLITTQGNTVNLSVSGNSSCTNQAVTFAVVRNGASTTGGNDVFTQPNPQVVNLASGSATTSWTAEFNPLLPFTNPQYYFTAQVQGGNTLDTQANLLTVTQSQGGNPTPTPVPTAPNDWPQVQKDPQHTGYSAETLGTNFQIAWTRAFSPERIHPQVQAIVAAGKVYVGSEVGNMYAVTAGASGGQVAWKFTAGGPIVSSAAFYNNRVYFGSLDGAIYAIDANTGAQVWRNQTSKLGFSASPVIADNKVLLGGRDGNFYALDPNDGHIIWKYDTGAPIFMTAAFDQGKVFFGAMNMFVYGLNTSPSNPNDSNTILAWKSAKIPAGAFKDFWPVVTQGKVFIIPNAKAPNPGIDPGYPFVWGPDWTWLSQNSTTIATGGAYLVPDIVNSQNTAITNYRTNPSRYNKNMYILDENTGQEAQVVPHWSTQTHSGTTTPPCVDREGKLVVPIMFMASGWGRLDINLGRITDILYDGYDIGGNLITSASRSNPMGFGNVDENYALSCTNNYILARHVNETTVGAGSTGVFNLDLRKWTIIGNEWTTPKQMQHNTQGGGTNAFTVSNGMIYDIVFHTLQARTTN